jgi:hypothetical protein
VTMKNAVFWDAAQCRFCVSQRSGGRYRFHLQGRKIRGRGTSVSRWLQSALADFSTRKMEGIRSSESFGHTKSTRRYIPEDGLLHPELCFLLSCHYRYHFPIQEKFFVQDIKVKLFFLYRSVSYS